MGASNSDFLNDYSAMAQFAEDFNEAVKLQKELSELFQGEDKRFNDIGQFIKDLAKITLGFFR